MDLAGVVVGVPAAAPEEAVLRTVFARVSGSVSSYQIGFVLGGTMQACDLLKVSLSVVQSAVSGRRWFGFYSVSDRKTSSGYRGYPRFVPVIS